MGIRIAVGEDQRMIRELLVALLSREPQCSVVGEASTGRETIDLTRATRPDVLILDVTLPDMDGIEVARAVREAQPGLKIVALSIHTEASVVQRMLKAGADGYVVKSAALAELVQAIRAVMSGTMYLSPAVARQALGDSIGRQASQKEQLGERERQVLGMIADGLRSAEIAAKLSISVSTVEAHRRNIMRKLDLHSIAELTKYAVREGLVSLERPSHHDD